MAAPLDPTAMDPITTNVMYGCMMVLFMTLPGLTLFYGALINRKNLVDTMLQSVILSCTVPTLWFLWGYSLAFGPSDNASTAPYWGGSTKNFLPFDPEMYYNGVREPVWCGFQLMFAIITPAVACGAVAERAKLMPLMIFANLWLLVVYCPIAHMTWAADGLLLKWGVLDLAGGLVVETCSGVTGLVLCYIIGPRALTKEEPDPTRAVLHIIGASILWVGWLAFNAGSAMTNGHQASMALMNTQNGAATAALAWWAAAYISGGRQQMSHTESVFNLFGGAVAGLVAATPSSGFVDLTGGVFIGVTAGFLCFWVDRKALEILADKYGIDDAVSVFPVHGVGGMWGILMTGVFAVKEVGGTDGYLRGNTEQFYIQAKSLGVVIAWVSIGTAICAQVVQLCSNLRGTPIEEERGFDYLPANGDLAVASAMGSAAPTKPVYRGRLASFQSCGDIDIM